MNYFKLFKYEQKKKRANNERILNKEFPWLWAVRQAWSVEDADIEVRNADNDMDFSELLKRKISSDYEIWVHHIHNMNEICYLEEVTAVTYEQSSEEFWAREIFFQIGSAAGLIKHILVIRKSRNPYARNGVDEEIQIFRLKGKNFPDFNLMIGNIIEQVKMGK